MMMVLVVVLPLLISSFETTCEFSYGEEEDLCKKKNIYDKSWQQTKNFKDMMNEMDVDDKDAQQQQQQPW